MNAKYSPDVSVFIRPDRPTFVMQRMLADWLPTPDWLLFMGVSLVIMASLLTNYLPLTRQIESRPGPIDLVSQQWHLDQIRAREAWAITAGSSDVIVAVVDTGVDYTHPDLAPNIWTNPAEIPNDGLDNDHNHYPDDDYGWDFIDNDGYPMPGEADGAEHGTMVAGIIGAMHHNGGVDGVNAKVQIMPVRVRTGQKGLDSFRPCSEGQYAYFLAHGIRYAADNKARVVNLSLSSSPVSQSLGRCVQDAVWYAFAQGVVIVAAAGNNNESVVSFPASMTPVIAVGALDERGQRMFINRNEGSNYGRALDVVAPGVDIWTTALHNRYKPQRGTSLAAAQVAGLAALLFAVDPSLSATQVKSYIETYARPVAGYDYIAGWNEETGRGCIDVYGALWAASPEGRSGQVR
ncbi:MAG: S8 family serine peptidase [Anaerolineae bacterium]|nr:S8 family serine peptidase [Anaerolineae bacterium]